MSKSAERRTRGPSPHHHINVDVLQAAIQIITNDLCVFRLNPFEPTSKRDGRKHDCFFPPISLPANKKYSDDGKDIDVRMYSIRISTGLDGRNQPSHPLPVRTLMGLASPACPHNPLFLPPIST